MERSGAGAAKDDLIFILIVLVCAVLIISSFKYLVFYAGADEGYYLKYASVVSESGIKAFPCLFKDYISTPKDWVYPSPLRIAFIIISAFWVKMFGAAYLVLSSLSLVSYLLTLGGSYYFCRKYFGNTAALLFSVLSGFSPLGMAMSRRALLDSTANLFLVMSLWLFFDMIEDRKRFKPAVFAACFSAAILCKESSALLMPVFAAYFLWRRYVSRKETRLDDILCAVVYPVGITAAAYLLAAGSVSNVFNVIKIVMSSPAANKYAILYCSGSWMRYMLDFFIISPPVLLLAAAFFIGYLFAGRRDGKIAYFSVTAILYFVFLNFFAKNIRYAMLLDMPIRLFAVLAVTALTDKVCGKYARLAAWLIVSAIAVCDYAAFHNFFIIHKIYDPVSVLLLRARGGIF